MVGTGEADEADAEALEAGGSDGEETADSTGSEDEEEDSFTRRGSPNGGPGLASPRGAGNFSQRRLTMVSQVERASLQDLAAQTPRSAKGTPKATPRSPRAATQPGPAPSGGGCCVLM